MKDYDYIKIFEDYIKKINSFYFGEISSNEMLLEIFNYAENVQVLYDKLKKQLSKNSKHKPTETNLKKLENIKELAILLKYLDDYAIQFLYYLTEDFPKEFGILKPICKEYNIKPFARIHVKSVLDLYKGLKEKNLFVNRDEYFLLLKADLDARTGAMLIISEKEANILNELNKTLGNKYNFIIWEQYNFKNISFKDGVGEDVFKETTKTL